MSNERKIKMEENSEWLEQFGTEIWSLQIKDHKLIAINTLRKIDSVPDSELPMILNEGLKNVQERAKLFNLELIIKDTLRCPNCNSDSIRLNGKILRSGKTIQRYQCKICGYSFSIGKNVQSRKL